MQSLYSNGFEHIYDKMYQTFIDYNDEYLFYSEILDTHNKSNVLEIGCGSGNLAKLFIESHINYSGLDLSNDMIKLSESKNPKGNFIQGDITNFKSSRKTDAIIITGRTSSYLTTNKNIFKALTAIYNNLNTGGILSLILLMQQDFFLKLKMEKT